jgi:hypothetical protein
MTRTSLPFDLARIVRYGTFVAVSLLAVGCKKKHDDAATADTPSATASAAPDEPQPKDKQPKGDKTAAPHDKGAPAKDPGGAPKDPGGSGGGDVAMRWEVYKAGNLKFEIPVAWSTRTESNNHLVVQPAEKNALIEFAAVPNGFAARGAEKEMLAEIGKIITNVKKTTGVKKFKQHECHAFTLEGKGKKNDAEVDWVSTGVGHKGGEILAIALFYKDVPEATKAQIRKSLESIQPGT